MVAQQPMKYQGRDLVAGECFECSVGYAVIAERKGRAMRRAAVPVEPRRRRTYRRRDLVAEPAE
jgi:hypothetical protein